MSSGNSVDYIVLWIRLVNLKLKIYHVIINAVGDYHFLSYCSYYLLQF